MRALREAARSHQKATSCAVACTSLAVPSILVFLLTPPVSLFTLLRNFCHLPSEAFNWTAEWHLPSVHFMLALLAFAVASELSAWKGEANEDVNLASVGEMLNRPHCPRCVTYPGQWVPDGCPFPPPCHKRPSVRSLEEENQLLQNSTSRCPACTSVFGLVPAGCPSVPKCLSRCPICIAFPWQKVPGGCPRPPLCPKPAAIWRNEEVNQESNIHSPWPGFCPHGVIPSPEFPCIVPFVYHPQRNDGWRAASLDA